jgi:thiamine transport system ATP-binding protein
MTAPNRPGGLVVRDLTVSYGARRVLDGVRLQVRPDEVVCLLGPSGSGKSTLLQVVAGLLPPDSGRVEWDGADLAGVPAHRRRFGLVFQDALLFPHLDVAGNVGYGLRVAGRPRPQAAERVQELLVLVGLAGYGSRAVATLSGGEAQRVALARALAPAPRLLLLDEPFGALDRDLRDRLAGDVRDLLHHLGTPAVHVTHDLAEAELVGDRVLRLPEIGRPAPAPGPV